MRLQSCESFLIFRDFVTLASKAEANPFEFFFFKKKNVRLVSL